MVVLLVSLGVLCLLDIGIFTDLDKLKSAFGLGPMVAVSLLWANLGVIGQEILFFFKIDDVSGSVSWFLQSTNPQQAWMFLLVPQAWSLSLELCFYAVVPFLVRLENRWIAFFFLLSLALRLYIGFKGPEYDLFARRFFPAELCFFLTGVFSCRLLDRVQNVKKRCLVGAFSFVVLVSAFFFFPSLDFPGALALLAFIAFLSVPFIFELTKDSRLDSFLGKISFPVYMVHFLIVAVFEERWEEDSLFVWLAAVLGAAVLAHLIIEVPIERWRQGRVVKTLARGLNCNVA
jgi:peptidoglycan/LPS O-acetylase OafA/YrhL